MSKPSIEQLAEYMEPLDDGGLSNIGGNTPPEGGGDAAIPGYGVIGAEQTSREAAARFRMIADAIEAGKNIPRSAVDIAVAMFDKIRPEAGPDPDSVGGFGGL